MVRTRGMASAATSSSAVVAEPTTQPIVENVARPLGPQRRRKRTKATARGHPWHPTHDFHLQASLTKDKSALPGQLQGLMDMPIDIFSEVCGCLAPLDLRHLSLTSPRLRDILMSQKATHMWKSSRRNTFPDMPDCPDDVSEPHYAYFMFVNECHGCDKRGTFMDFLHCLRFCADCEAPRYIGVKRVHFWYRGYPTGLLPDIALNNNAVMWTFQMAGNYTRKYYGDEVAELYETFAALPKDITADGELTPREEFVREFEISHLARQKAGGFRRAWLYSEIERQKNVRKDIHEQRVSFVTEQCVKLGYEKFDVFDQQQMWNRWYDPVADENTPGMTGIMNRHFEMTEIEWEEVRPEVEAVVQGNRARREAQEASNRRYTRERTLIRRGWEVRRANLPIAGFHYPRDDQLLQFDPIKAILEVDTPDITEDMWATVADAAAQFVEREQLSVLKDLCGRLSILEDTDDPASMAKKLSLATSAFICTHCDTAMWFPDLVTHSDPHKAGCLLGKMIATPPGLVAAILRTLELSEDSTYEALQKAYGDYYVCARCDPKVTDYYTISELIVHFFQAHSWFTKAISIDDRKTAYPNLEPDDPLPNLVDDHDWMQDVSLCKEYRGTAKGTLSKLQSRFQRQIKADPDDDWDNVELAWNERRSGLSPKRTCLLCPAGFSPLPTSAAELKLHIEIRHVKAPNLATDAALFSPSDSFPHTPCPQTIR